MPHYYFAADYQNFEIGEPVEKAYAWAVEQAELRRAEGNSAHVEEFSRWVSMYSKWHAANREAVAVHYVLYEFWSDKEFQTRLIGVYATEELAKAKRADLELLMDTPDAREVEYLIDAVPYTPAF